MMKVPIPWLKEYLETEASLSTIVKALDSIGLMVSSVFKGEDGEKSSGLSADRTDFPSGAKSFLLKSQESKANIPVLSIEVTPNRGDCLSIRGIARELEVKGVGKMKSVVSQPIVGNFEMPFSIALDSQEKSLCACYYFLCCVIKDIKNKVKKTKIQEDLKSIGLESISPVVDITNWVAHDMGQPMHAFDVDRIKGKVIYVRLSKDGESFVSLTGKELILKEGMTVVCDESGIISLAGIIGGQRTACESDTKNILLESAVFSRSKIASAGRLLGITSSSRYRFERGVDFSIAFEALGQATKLILESCGGSSSNISETIVNNSYLKKKVITFDFCSIKNLGGVLISKKIARKILTRLGFTVKPLTKSKVEVTSPSWRYDINETSSLVSEILRIHGYEHIKSQNFSFEVRNSGNLIPQKNLWAIRRVLSGHGLIEAVSLSFLSKELATLFQGGNFELQIKNPLSQSLTTMRPSLVPSLLLLLKKNLDHHIKGLSFFEVGYQFNPCYFEMQTLAIAGILFGQKIDHWHWNTTQHLFNMMDVKLLTEIVLNIYEINCPKIIVKAPSWYHPRRAASFYVDSQKDPVVYFGEINPVILRKMGLIGPVFSFEILVDFLPSAVRGKESVEFQKVSKFTFVERDFSFLFRKSIQSTHLLEIVKNSSPSLITKVSLFDVYEGKGIPEGMKSISFTVRFESIDRNLNRDEIQDLTRRVIAYVSSESGGILREKIKN